MRIFKITFASAGIAALLLPAGAMAGGSLTRADFERCNQQAMQVAGISDSQSPAASPGMSSPGRSGSGAGSSGSMGSGTGSYGSSTSGSMSGGSGTTGSTTGAGSSAATSSADQEKIDRAVLAFRDCLQGR